MTATGHAIIGTVIAATISNPVIAIPLALVSHFAADAFPHWDAGTNIDKKSAKRFLSDTLVDVGLSFIISFVLLHFLFPQTSILYALVIILAAQFFDWGAAPYIFFDWKFPPFTWFVDIQKPFNNKMDLPWGMVYQVIFLFFLVAFALLL